MANEWQSLLQGAPNLQNLNLLGNFNTGYSTAVEQKKTAYDMYRQQKAQEIASKARRADGTMDWDAMFKMGSDAGIGLDAFNQVQKMQQARRENEVAVLQHRANLESMGYDPTRWDSSAKPMDVLMRERQQATEQGFDQTPTPAPSAPQPYVPPTAEQAKLYDFVTNPTEQQIVASRLAGNAPGSETQIPQAQAQQFGAQGVGETTQSPAPDQGKQMNLGAGNIAVGQLPAPAMRDPDLDSRVTEGYLNQLWRTGRSQADAQRAMGLDSASTEVPLFDITGMHGEQRDRLAKFLAMQGINPGETDAELQTAVQLRKQAVVDAIPQPAPVMPEGMGFEAMAKAQNPNRKNMIDWVKARQEAGIAFDKAMQEGNYAVLEKQLAQTASGLAKRQDARQQRMQEHELASLTPDTNPLIHREVSRAELGKIQDMQAGYADYTDAVNAYTRNPSLGNIGALAVAKLKANGQPVTMDGIESYILSSGAVPRESELILKRALRDMDVPTLLGAKAISLSGLGITESEIDPLKLKNEKENIEWDIYRRGGLPYEGYMSPLGKAPSGKGGSGAKYSETKTNAAGMKMGRRSSDGKWEPVR